MNREKTELMIDKLYWVFSPWIPNSLALVAANLLITEDLNEGDLKTLKEAFK